jgi:hypothetical protein
MCCIERGDFPICPRCGLGIGPDDLWDLGHDDYDPRIERPDIVRAIAPPRTS